MKNLFKKKQDRLLVILHDQADATVKGLELMSKFISQPGKEISEELKKMEKAADEHRRILIFELNKSFITPIDREDLFALSRSIDDILDYAYTTVTEIELLKVKPTQYMQRIATLLLESSNEILQAVDRLQDHPGVAGEHASRAKALENRVEAVYREALAELFSGADTVKNVMKILKLREVYRHLSNAADRGDDAANVIADIVVKIS